MLKKKFLFTVRFCRESYAGWFIFKRPEKKNNNSVFNTSSEIFHLQSFRSYLCNLREVVLWQVCVTSAVCCAERSEFTILTALGSTVSQSGWNFSVFPKVIDLFCVLLWQHVPKNTPKLVIDAFYSRWNCFKFLSCHKGFKHIQKKWVGKTFIWRNTS